MRRKLFIGALILCVVCFSLYAQDTVVQDTAKSDSTGDSHSISNGKEGAEGSSTAERNVENSESTIGKSVQQPERKVRERKPANRTEITKETSKREKTSDEKDAEKKNAPKGEFSGQGLLIVGEGNETIRRIPDIIIQETKAQNDTIVRIPKDVEKKAPRSRGTGIFGLNKDTSDIVVRVLFLVFIFIVTILLYKTRSRRSGKRVVRTFPKK